MIIKKIFFLSCVLCIHSTDIYAMKHSEDAVCILGTSNQESINTVIFETLPPELLPKIISYAVSSKNVLMNVCKQMYRLFCYMDHLTPTC